MNSDDPARSLFFRRSSGSTASRTRPLREAGSPAILGPTSAGAPEFIAMGQRPSAAVPAGFCWLWSPRDRQACQFNGPSRSLPQPLAGGTPHFWGSTCMSTPITSIFGAKARDLCRGTFMERPCAGRMSIGLFGRNNETMTRGEPLGEDHSWRRPSPPFFSILIGICSTGEPVSSPRRRINARTVRGLPPGLPKGALARQACKSEYDNLHESTASENSGAKEPTIEALTAGKRAH